MSDQTPLTAETGLLLQVAHALSAYDQKTAASLIAWAQQYGKLTEKQLWLLRELTKRGVNAIAPEGAAKPVATPVAAPAARNFGRIVELFAKAGTRAAIVFRTAGGYEFRLNVAGTNAQQPGTINVTDANPGGFETRTWFGRIGLDGSWQPSRRVGDTTAVEAALAQFNADPAAAAAQYGHDVGSCCFCRRELTDERSVSVGYGPICADKFGLPWGEVTGPKAESKLECDIPF